VEPLTGKETNIIYTIRMFLRSIPLLQLGECPLCKLNLKLIDNKSISVFPSISFISFVKDDYLCTNLLLNFYVIWY